MTHLAEYPAFTWLMRNPDPKPDHVVTSRYLLIDRLVINIETLVNGDTRALAAIRDTYDEARDHALGPWMRGDDRGGLVLDEEVTTAPVHADLVDLAEMYDDWNDIDPALRSILRALWLAVPV